MVLLILTILTTWSGNRRTFIPMEGDRGGVEDFRIGPAREVREQKPA